MAGSPDGKQNWPERNPQPTPTADHKKGATTMKRYNLKTLMLKAWSLYRKALKKGTAKFADALRTAWAWLKVQAANAEKVEAAATAAGIDAVIHTWAGWQAMGRMVMHEEEAVLKVEIADPTTKKGTRIASYFTYEQTYAPIA